MTREERREWIRRALDEALVTGRDRLQHNLLLNLTHRAQRESVPIDDEFNRQALLYWWDLARCGAVAMWGDRVDGNAFELTPAGSEWLATGEAGPHDRLGYQRRLEAIAQPHGGLDPVVAAYAGEAVGCWLAGQHRATLVMVGVACERLVVLLAEALARTNHQQTAKLKAELEKSKQPPVSALFELVRMAIEALRQAKTLVGAPVDGIDRQLTAIFEHVRVLRNQQGHPSGDSVDIDEAHSALLLLPNMLRRVLELRAAL